MDLRETWKLIDTDRTFVENYNMKDYNRHISNYLTTKNRKKIKQSCENTFHRLLSLKLSRNKLTVVSEFKTLKEAAQHIKPSNCFLDAISSKVLTVSVIPHSSQAY